MFISWHKFVCILGLKYSYPVIFWHVIANIELVCHKTKINQSITPVFRCIVILSIMYIQLTPTCKRNVKMANVTYMYFVELFILCNILKCHANTYSLNLSSFPVSRPVRLYVIVIYVSSSHCPIYTECVTFFQKHYRYGKYWNRTKIKHTITFQKFINSNRYEQTKSRK